MRVFERQISFIGKIYQAAFYQPLFTARIKPAGRIRDIVKDSCGNRHTSTACLFAAGVLLIKEAGGVITNFHGQENYLQHDNMIAGNPEIYNAVLPIIQSCLLT